MEKLLNLLNEYETTLEPNEQIEWTENGVKATPLIIISNGYGFIKWLVENDKIKYRWKPSDLYYDVCSSWVGTLDNIIMHLSISDTPIEDLISYLK